MIGFESQLGYLGIIVVLALTGVGLPVPEELPVVIAGVMSAQGSLDPWLALAACILGAITGDSLMYLLGRFFGHSFLYEHPRFAHLLHAERERQIERMIRKHGLKVFFLARFLVGVRSPIYLSAGILRVPFRKFLLADLFCATTVVGTFFGLSYAFADHIVGWFDMLRNFEITLTVVVLLGVGGAALYYWRRHKRKQRRRPEAEKQMHAREDAAQERSRTRKSDAKAEHDDVKPEDEKDEGDKPEDETKEAVGETTRRIA